MRSLLETVYNSTENTFERRQIIYGILEKLKLTNDEPLTDELLAFVSSLAEN